MKKNSFGIQELAAAAVGTALFAALTKAKITIGIPDVFIQPRMAVLAFFAAVFGPVTGSIVGLAGHALGDALFYKTVIWSWAVPEVIVGALIGFFAVSFEVREGRFIKSRILLFNAVQIIANILAWLILAPILDILIYKEAAGHAFLQGFWACLLNSGVILVLGTLLLAGFGKMAEKVPMAKKDR